MDLTTTIITPTNNNTSDNNTTTTTNNNVPVIVSLSHELTVANVAVILTNLGFMIDLFLDNYSSDIAKGILSISIVIACGPLYTAIFQSQIILTKTSNGDYVASEKHEEIRDDYILSVVTLIDTILFKLSPSSLIFLIFTWTEDVRMAWRIKYNASSWILSPAEVEKINKWCPRLKLHDLKVDEKLPLPSNPNGRLQFFKMESRRETEHNFPIAVLVVILDTLQILIWILKWTKILNLSL
jgi:hypothetical protein